MPRSVDGREQPWSQGAELAPRPAPRETARPLGAQERGGISIAGRRVPIGAPVVLWSDPGGHDAYAAAERHESFRPGREDPSRPGRSAADRAAVDAAVSQLVLHYDACGTSARCFDVLQARGLSVHFLLDLDGTLYQTLDLAETAWHASAANPRSVGVEIANIGAYPPGDGTLDAWYRSDAQGVVAELPAGATLRTPRFVARPARAERQRGAVQGTLLEQYDLTPEQYETLARLTAVLVRELPRLDLAVPRDAGGRVRAEALPAGERARFRGIVGHHHVSEDKTDPGPAFDWSRYLSRTREVLAGLAN